MSVICCVFKNIPELVSGSSTLSSFYILENCTAAMKLRRNKTPRFNPGEFHFRKSNKIVSMTVCLGFQFFQSAFQQIAHRFYFEFRYLIQALPKGAFRQRAHEQDNFLPQLITV